MALTSSQITNQIITQLRLLDPAISAEVGTPERKIIEAVAEQIASASSDLQVLDSQNDIDSMVGGRLDAFLSIFGFGRQKAIAATGIVTFSRASTATSDIVIPSGTQVIAKQSDIAFPDLYFATTQTSVLATGGTSVDVPVICTTPGTLGNVAAGAIVSMASIQIIQGITSVNSAAAMTGGIDGESDAEFKVRFKNTIFRNISGTTDQYLALAVAAPFVTKANVIGPMSRYQEYVQVPGVDDSVQIHADYDPVNPVSYPKKRTVLHSTIPYSKYTYSYNEFVTNGDFGTSTIFYRPNVDFVFNNPALTTSATIDTAALAKNQPNFTVINLYDAVVNPDGVINGGDVLLFEHSYISTSSRNKISQIPGIGQVTQNILNCVDVFIDGSNVDFVSSIEVMPSTNNNFNSTPASFAYNLNFLRSVDGTVPLVGNRFMPLYWQPVMSIPDSIIIGATRYFKANYKNPADGQYYNDSDFTVAASYWLVVDQSDFYGTIRARNGIEWSNTVAGQLVDPNSGSVPTYPGDPANVGLPMSVDSYSYDRNIADIQAVMEKQKQVTADVLVHQAFYRYFKLYITVMYTSSSSPSTVDQAIASTLSSWFKSQYFGAVIQLSDLLQVIHNVPGVDNVRWSSEYDTTKFSTGTVLPTLPNGSYPTGSVFKRTTDNTFWITDSLIWTALPHKVEQVNPDGSRFVSPIYFDTDFYLLDDQLPAVSSNFTSDPTTAIVVQRRAQGTWNT